MQTKPEWGHVFQQGGGHGWIFLSKAATLTLAHLYVLPPGARPDELPQRQRADFGKVLPTLHLSGLYGSWSN